MNELWDVAYNKERISSRRLAKRTGMSESDALKQTLQAIAGPQSLSELIANRQQLRADAAARTSARQQQKEAVRTQKSLARQPDPTAWLAWFDGATHPNPGKMGIGAILKSPDGGVKEISFNAGLGDSSAAEYIALIAVLEAAVVARPAKLVVYGDSQVVINDVNPATVRGSHALTEKRERARRLIAQLPDITLRWIPRAQNAAADALSQQAVTQAPASIHNL